MCVDGWGDIAERTEQHTCRFVEFCSPFRLVPLLPIRMLGCMRITSSPPPPPPTRSPFLLLSSCCLCLHFCLSNQLSFGLLFPFPSPSPPLPLSLCFSPVHLARLLSWSSGFLFHARVAPLLLTLLFDLPTFDLPLRLLVFVSQCSRVCVWLSLFLCCSRRL